MRELYGSLGKKINRFSIIDFPPTYIKKVDNQFYTIKAYRLYGCIMWAKLHRLFNTRTKWQLIWLDEKTLAAPRTEDPPVQGRVE